MRKTLLILLGLTLVHNVSAQKPLVWQILGMTTHKNNLTGDGSMIPDFPDVLEKQYEGKEVMISGYMIPVDVSANSYALSKNPFSSCFFCGNAGPETVIELRFKEPPGRFVTDEYVMIKGILQLNRNGYGMFFTLKNAELHG